MTRLLTLVGLLMLTACASGAQEIPEDARFVASVRGSVFYPIGCRDVWTRLSPANLRWFTSAEEALAADYEPTTNRSCRPYWTLVPEPPTLAVRVEPSTGSPLSAPDAYDGSCTVDRVIDGDTIVCVGGERIRLLMIDAPESRQEPFGAAARAALEEMVAGRTLGVEYDVQRTDRYGRTLAYLWSDDGQVNARMVASGMALVLTIPPNVRYVDTFVELQRTAREGRRGLWAVDGFECPPGEYRARRCG